MEKYIVLALFSGFLFVILDLLYKFTSCSKIPSEIFVTLWYIICGILASVYFVYHNKVYRSHINNNLLFIILITSVITFIGNILYFKSSRLSYNPGLSRTAFTGGLIVSLTIISSIIFKRYITYKQITGVMFILLGIILLTSD